MKPLFEAVHDRLVAILKGMWCGQRYSRSKSVLFLPFVAIFSQQRREPFIRVHTLYCCIHYGIFCSV